MVDNSCPLVTLGVILGIGLLLLVILLPLSFQGLEYYEYGFKRQKSTGKVNTDKVYTGGKHMVGPDYEFKTFTATAHFVDQRLDVFTSDKITVDIDVYFQYFLRKEDLPILHKKYDKNYEAVVIKNAITTLKAEAPSYGIEQYFKDRPTVEAGLYKAVRERLGGICCQDDCTAWKYACPPNCIPMNKCNSNKDKGMWVDVKYFQLGQVRIDNDVVDRYLTKLTLIEENEKEKMKQEAQVIRKATSAKIEEIQNQAKEIRQKAEAQSQLINTVSKANYTVAVEKARSEGLKLLYNRLGITDQALKNSFDYLRTLRSLNHVHFTVDFQQRIVGSL